MSDGLELDMVLGWDGNKCHHYTTFCTQNNQLVGEAQMNNLEFYAIMFCYTVLDLAVGIGLGIWIAAKIAEWRLQ